MVPLRHLDKLMACYCGISQHAEVTISEFVVRLSPFLSINMGFTKDGCLGDFEQKRGSYTFALRRRNRVLTSRCYWQRRSHAALRTSLPAYVVRPPSERTIRPAQAFFDVPVLMRYFQHVHA